MNLNYKVSRFFGMSAELITLMFLSRLVVDSGNRIFLPFIPQLSSGLGLTIKAFSWVAGFRSLIGIFSPFVGTLANRYGRRRIMAISLALRGIGFLGFGLSTGWWSAIPMLIISFTTTSYLPIQKAYVSDQVKPERRGRALAAVDASFSTAGMVGLPIFGWVVENFGWRQPMFFLAGLCFLSALVISIRLPKTRYSEKNGGHTSNLRNLIRQPNVGASVIVSSLQIFIFIFFMTFWALWLSTDFDYGALDIGLTGKTIGIAEFTGLLLAMLFIDLIGKRRGSLISLAVSIPMFALLLAFRQNELAAVMTLVLIALVIEFALTSTIPLFADQALRDGTSLFTLVAFGNTIGAGLAVPAATYLWDWIGLEAIVAVGLISSSCAFYLVWRYLFDQGKQKGSGENIFITGRW